MVELSDLYGLDIYTSQGKYVGRVQDVILNIKKGRVSKLKARAMSPEKKDIKITEVLKKGIRIVPESDEIRPLKEEGMIDIPYDSVKAVGDILIISPEVKRSETPKSYETPIR